MSAPDADANKPVMPKRKRGRASRILRGLLWLTLIVVLLGVVLRLLLPTLVERGTAYGSRHYLGLPARLGNIDFFFWEGNVVLEDVSVGALPDGVTPKDAARNPPAIDRAKALLHFDRLTLGWSWRELFNRKVRLTKLVVEAPAVRVLREEDGKIDPMRRAKPLAKPSAQKKPVAEPKPSEPWPIELQSLAVQAPSTVISDATSGENLLEFSLENFELGEVTASGADIGLGAMAIRGPVLRVQRKLVLAGAGAEKQAAAADAAPMPAESPAPGSARPAFRLKKIDVERAKFTWVSPEGPLDVMLTFKAAGVTAEEGRRFPFEIALQTGSGKIAVAGDAGILPPYYKGKVTWEGLSFPPLLLAAEPALAAWLRSADASGELDVTADVAGSDGAPRLQLSGHTTLDSFAVADPGGSEVSVAWKRLDVVIGEILVPFPEADKPPRTTTAQFERISLEDPSIRYTHPAPSLKTLGSGGSAETPESTASPQEPAPQKSQAKSGAVELSIALFELKNGDIEIHDTSVSTTSTLRDLAVTLRDVRFPEQTFVALSLQATLPTASKLSIEGSLKSGMTGDFVIGLQQLDLPTFSPYAKGAGVSLDAGTVSVQTKLGMRGAVIKAHNEVVLNKLGVSLRDPDSFAKEFGVPVDLALALLSDPSGDIKLTVPVQMDEKGATVSAGAIIGSALRAAIIGAISSPLKLLGAGFGNDDASKKTARGVPSRKGRDVASAPASPFSIAPINSVPGNADPAADAPARIEGFVKLLAERPGMGLVLRGRVSAEDRPIVAGQILLEGIKAGQDLPEIPDAGFLARRRINQVLAKRGKGETVELEAKDRALYERYVAAVQIPEERLVALAKQRAEKVQAMLVAKGAKPGNLSIGEREADGDAGVVISFRQAQPDGEKPVQAGKTKKRS